ncbi:hypothetical protein [Corynebacterium freiburgense]|uniref:hypothetical protein n=1 Tax=Corynebacterium freiburgense TaxID=556548 RepID=UPI0003F8644E|nr:hypothetical protein [Corynebacterium freiburgense]WJZ01804.1 hypothetical protein CFREI_02500 [Corynebacterium freiburgense]
MSHNLDQIIELRDRLEVFLGKLKERAVEITAEAKTVTPEPSSQDQAEIDRQYATFETALRKQMQDITERGENIFQERFEAFANDKDPQIRKIYLQAESDVEEFEKEIRALTDDVFAPSTNSEAERHFKQAIADWKEAEAKFKCKSCGAPVAIPELYYQAKYLRCSVCGTQTLFTPTTNMQVAPQWAEALADSRTATLKAELDRIAKAPTTWPGQLIVARIKYALTRHRHLIELLPGYAPTQVDSLRRAVFMEAHSKKHSSIEPAGLRKTDTTYYNVMGSLGDTLKDFRAQNDTVFVGIVTGIVHDLTRPGCEVAASVLDNSFTHKLWAKYSRIARQQPEV